MCPHLSVVSYVLIVVIVSLSTVHSSLVNTATTVKLNSSLETPEVNLNQKQIDDHTSPDLFQDIVEFFFQFVDFDKVLNINDKADAKSLEEHSESRGVGKWKRFFYPFLIGVSLKTKTMIFIAIGFLIFLTKITFIKSKIALVIGVGLLLYHLYSKKHGIHHVKDNYQPVAIHYDLNPSWSAPYPAFAYPDLHGASFAGSVVSNPTILRKTFQT